MWQSKGRSGIGDTNIQGTWDDWDGLSPNGRQYKNTITQECRDLSGSAYWHTRKANNPEQAGNIPTFINGKPNIRGFSDEQETDSKPSGVFVHPYCVMPGEEEIEALDEQQLMLYRQYKAKRLSLDKYQSMTTALRDKQRKAWDRYEKSLTKSL